MPAGSGRYVANENTTLCHHRYDSGAFARYTQRQSGIENREDRRIPRQTCGLLTHHLSKTRCDLERWLKAMSR